VLHKLNDMIEELEREVKPDQVDAETAPNSVEASTAKDVISYPKVGVAYDPKQINTWSNLRGFQNPAQILQKSSWLGLTVAPGAVPSAIQPKSTAVKQDDGEECEDEPQNKQSSPKKTSLFQDIFNERLPSPDRTEDDVPTQAFFRRKVPETVAEPTPKPVAKSNNLSKALQSRLQRRKLSIDDQKTEGTKTRSTSRERKGKKRRRKSRSSSSDENRLRKSFSRSSRDTRDANDTRASKNMDRRQSRSRHNSGVHKSEYRHKERSVGSSADETQSRVRRAREIPTTSGKKLKRKGRKRDRSRSYSSYNSRSASPSDKRNKGKKKRKVEEQDEGASKRADRSSSTSASSSPQYSSRNRQAATGHIKLAANYSDDESSHTDQSPPNLHDHLPIKSHQRRSNGDDLSAPRRLLNSDHEDEEKMIEKIRRKRAKLLAKRPAITDSAADIQWPPSMVEMETEKGAVAADVFERSVSKDNRVPITCFQQDPEDGRPETSQFKTVVLCGSVLYDGQFSQLFQLSASVLGQSNSFFQCSFPELLKKSSSLTIGSRNEVRDTLGLKSSKFDVSKEGMDNVYYKHPSLGSIPTASEKEMLLGLINFLQGLGESVVLFLHYKDSLLPTLLAKLNKYKLFDHFSDLVLYCCDMVGLAWSLHLDHLWTGKHYPGLITIAENVDSKLSATNTSDNLYYSSLLVTVLSQMMASNHLNIQKVLEMSNKMNLLEYMSVKYSMIQGIKVEIGPELPEYLELSESHDAWGVRTRVDLVWTSLEGLTQMLRGERKIIPEKRATPLPIPEAHDGEDQVTIIKPGSSLTENKGSSLKLKARQFLAGTTEPCWDKKTYNVFLSPGTTTIPENSTSVLELRVPALQMRIDQLCGKAARVEGTADFTLCKLLPTTTVIQKSDTSLFPFVKVTISNPTFHPVKLSSEMITYAVATLRLEQA